MKLHWSPRSPYVRKVMITAHELGLGDRLELVRSVADMKRPNADLMIDNPLSKIPTLVLDDGRQLIDSAVICEYLDDLAGGDRLFPPRGPDRWQALGWHALGNGLLDVLILWRNEANKPVAQQMPEWLSAFQVKTDAALDRMNALVAALDVARFGIGHVAIGCALGYLDFRFADIDWRQGRPSLAAWHARFEARPSAVATGARDG